MWKLRAREAVKKTVLVSPYSVWLYEARIIHTWIQNQRKTEK
jgi:hypothetical protein